MMQECSTGELLTRAAIMHHADQGHDALKYHAVLKGLKALTVIQYVITFVVMANGCTTGEFTDALKHYFNNGGAWPNSTRRHGYFLQSTTDMRP